MTTREPPPANALGATAIELLDRLRDAYGSPERRPPDPPIDELIQTILSQHTSDVNTERAFASLRARFATWDEAIDAPTEQVADAIRSGGLADVKAPRIQQALRDVRERTGGFDLSFLGELPDGEARDWLTELHGVGPKTASCVLLFSLDRAVMPVDTHVHRVSLRLGLVPHRTSAERAHELLEQQIPDDRMYEAHMLFIQHGRRTCLARNPRCGACVLVQWCPAAATFLEHSPNRLDTDDGQAY
jgi:endonuclease III